VFRFNNPEEVRKQRVRATMKSNLQNSISAADLEAVGADSPRPDSPTSSDEDMGGNVDWNYAKREAALAKLGLDPQLDDIPDEDLNKLYEKITKVKTMRDQYSSKSRPESSLSVADDIWSETGRGPLPSDTTTDDTSLYAAPWGSPFTDEPLRETQATLEARLEELDGEETTEAEDLKAEKEHMEHQLRLVKAQMRRMIDARARGELDAEAAEFEPVIYSARQLRLIRKVLDRWRAHRAFSMAEQILINAVAIKEANVIW
jgi:kinesin family protein 1